MKRLLTHAKLVAIVAAAVSALALSVGTARALNPEQARPEGVVTALKGSINTYWYRVFTRRGLTYRSPTRVTYYTETANRDSACGFLGMNNSFYCFGDHVIYLDYNWNLSLIQGGSDLEQESGQHIADDYVAGAVLAHEWGHHIQGLLGFGRWARENGYSAGMELQADCYAGMYTRYGVRTGLVNSNDVAWAKYLFLHIGDGFFNDVNYAYDPYDDSHGSGRQRLYWFMAGYNHQNLRFCGMYLYKTVYHL